MKKWCRRSLAFFAVAIIAGCGTEPTAPPSGGTLSVQTRDGSHLAGSFAYADSLIQFEGRFESADRQVVSLDVNGTQLTFTIDHRVWTWDGGNAAFFREDREALL